MSRTINKFTGFGKKGTEITPEEINGYTAPATSVTLTEDNQQITFTYTPILYNIVYNLDGGVFISEESYKSNYTIENTYTPPDVQKTGYIFLNWEPKKIIEGTTGDITLTAKWTPAVGAKLMDGPNLNKALKDLIKQANGENEQTYSYLERMSLNNDKPDNTDSAYVINVSTNEIPIYVEYNPRRSIMYWYCKDQIICPADMSNAFEGLTSLRSVSSLISLYHSRENNTLMFVVKEPNTDVSNMFRNTNISLNEYSSGGSWYTGDRDGQTISKWCNNWENISNYENMFKDSALEWSIHPADTTYINRIDKEGSAMSEYTPSKYLTTCHMTATSSTGGSLVSRNGNPTGIRATLFAKYMQFPHPKQAQLFEGYQNPEPQTISPDGGEYSFVFPVIEYPITYHMNDDAESPATNPNTKTKCTIEDDEYVLQSPTRTGYTFKRWNTYEEDYESGAISKIPAHSMESYVLYAIWTRNE